jgi:ethanolamine utilization microcompartment shell protein EutS
MLTIKTINSPSRGTINIILRKIHDESIKSRLEDGAYNSLGLIQGPLAEIIVAGDIAEKASNVDIAEIPGVCPQHITMIGVFGDTAAVSEALKAVNKLEESFAGSGELG